MRGGVGRLSGIEEPRRAERGIGDERSVAFGRGDGAADAANTLSGRNGVLPVRVAVRLRVCLAPLDRETYYGH